MHTTRLIQLLLVYLVTIIGCVPPEKYIEGTTDIDIKNPEVQKILALQTAQNTDSLASYFDSPEPLMRMLVASAMASIQDSTFADSLVMLLKDPSLEVRTKAAFALGQLKDTSYARQLVDAFTGRDSVDVNNRFNSTILEALGKVGDQSTADLIASVETYRPTDSLLLEGQMYSLFRFGLREIAPTSVVNLCIKYLNNSVYTSRTRLIAAHILGRIKNIDLRGNKELTALLIKEQDPFVKMALVLAAGKNDDTESKEALKQISFSSDDYRIRCNAVKALSNFINETGIADTILLLANSDNPHIAMSAADAALKIKNLGNLVSLWKADSVATKPIVKAKLLQAIMNNHGLYLTVTKDFIKNMAIQRMNASTDPFVKAEYIKVLGYDPYQYQNLINLPVKSKLEELAKLSALDNIINNAEFITAFKNNYINVKREILYFIASKIRAGDPGLAAEGAVILSKESNQAKALLKDSTFIDEAWSKLSNPRDVETMQNLNDLSSMMYGKTQTIGEKKLKGINFSRLASLKDSATVVVKTTQGNITILLYPKNAPASVSNFLDLCISDFYDDKIFHRVVPNFVIQTGCPRGDGYGGMDYTIPSEVDDMKYDDEGYVGMASAGLHTEGSQFFITHSPTPHLDGRYTIFGKVITGMDVVHKIEVGDKIIDAILTK